MLAGALSEEDEDAVLAELEAITQVGCKLNLYKCRGCIFNTPFHVSALLGLLEQLAPAIRHPVASVETHTLSFEEIFRQLRYVTLSQL